MANEKKRTFKETVTEATDRFFKKLFYKTLHEVTGECSSYLHEVSYAAFTESCVIDDEKNQSKKKSEQ